MRFLLRLLYKIIWYVLAIVICIGGIFFGVLPLIEAGYQYHYGEDNIYLISGNATGIPIILSLALFMIVVWLFSPDGLRGYFEEEDGSGIKAHFSMKKKLVVLSVSICLAIVGSIGSMCWFERFTLDGVERHCFIAKKEYGWKDVEYFTLKADSHGVLMFEVRMQDGTKHYFNGGILRWAEYYGDGFEKKFPEDVYDYMVWLAEKLGSQNIPMRVEDWEDFMEELDYESWQTLAEEIKNVYEKAG